VELESLVEVSERRVLSKLLSIMDNVLGGCFGVGPGAQQEEEEEA